MPVKNVYFVILDKFADWEAAPLAAVINQTAGWQVQTVAPEKTPLCSIGGFTVVPDMDVLQAHETKFAGLVLVGGMSWKDERAKSVEPLVRLALERNVAVGAICDATLFLAGMGILNDIPHTSNLPDALKKHAGEHYSGEKHYQKCQAVRSQRIVTANGAAAMDFGREMLVALGIFSEEDAGKWYRLFKHGFYEATEEGFWWLQRMENEG